MISRVLCGVICLLALTLSTPVHAATKSAPSVVKIESPIRGDLRAGQSLAAAAACTTGSDTAFYWLINGWVYGNELYKGYVDPALWCPGPYPFTVQEVNMPMYLKAGSSITISVDVEALDNTVPGCTGPGNLLSISSTYTLGPAPQSGIYNLWIPLDSTVTVNGPFFVGFFIGNAVDPAVDSFALVTDNSPAPCNSYNIWDTTIGFVDLNDNATYNFPGKLMLYCNGTTGGSGGTAPAPAGALLSPKKSEFLMGPTEFWFNETSGSNIINYAAFEWKNGTTWTEIARDYDGGSPLRDGVTAAVPGEGWSYQWNLSGMPEGVRQIRAVLNDTLARTVGDSFNVFFEPTPPLSGISSPENGADICPQTSFNFATTDENMQFIELYKKDAQTNFSVGITTMNQATVGDANGNVNDGNHAANNEYGDYYCGPVAATLAVKYLADHGVPNIMLDGGTPLTMSQVAERLAIKFKTRFNKGTYDNLFFAGLRDYIIEMGDEATVGFDRNPSYFDIRTWAEEEQRIVMLGLGGNPGLWVTVDGFSGWFNDADSTYNITVSNPKTGALEPTKIRNSFPTSELMINGVWHPIDIMISALAKNLTVSRTLIGADASSANGWSINWTPTNLTDGNLYFFRARGVDMSNYSKTATILLRYNCSNFYTIGDYNGDGLANVVDLTWLTNYFGKKGPAPVGGVARADANCDNVVNIADMIYYMNYLFGTVSAPCH